MTTSTERQSMKDYVAQHRITVTRVTDKGLQRDAGGWEHYAYTVQLTHGHTMARITVPWMQGTGITTDPRRDPAAILSSLALDASAWLDHTDVEDFAAEFGYPMDEPADRRRAAGIFKACHRSADNLAKFLGSDDELEHRIRDVESD